MNTNFKTPFISKKSKPKAKTRNRNFVNSRKEKFRVTENISIPSDAYYFVDPEGPPAVLEDVNSRERYPFSLMELEGSFYTPGLSARDMRGAIQGATKRYNHKYISRTVPGGARVWRHI